MKNQKIVPGIILLGFGIYFYLEQAKVSLFQEFYDWPTLLMIVGIAFLVQGYRGRDYESIFPGVILVGFGIHFHIVNRFELWPDHLGAFILIIALGFLLRYQKTGNGLFYGVLFLIIAGMLLFYDRVTRWFGLMGTDISTAWRFWPAALVIIGIYLLFFKKK
ncbi:DUF5668 domain-containing protein [Bacillus sp. REN3]|uniref:LiaI-LiaF-like domain-containing protein n=1 Tax=Bacillus sp. REN3 TaxID=2802440 RepID=UPI001AED8569|nr:DUF5668 domain-containing protein [Bacillus sp. REN3]